MRVFIISLLLLFLTGCSADNQADDNVNSGYPYGEVFRLSEADQNTETDNLTEINLSGEQEIYTIERAGDYILTGVCKGQIQIDVQDQIVHLILENLEMQSMNGPVIYVKSAAKVVITVPEGSSCILMDSADYSGYKDAQACVYSEEDLTINGEGKLQVYGYYKDAIRTKDVLKILDVNLEVKAKGVGLRGNDGVVVWAESVNLQCEGTGIYTENGDKADRGFVDIAGGVVNIIAGEYGIDAAQNVYIHDCAANIYGTVCDVMCTGEQYIEEGCLK